MSLQKVNEGGLVLLGCGRMGSALLKGWLEAGVDPKAVTVLDPHPGDWLKMLEDKGLRLNAPVERAAVCVLAVKPQLIEAAGDLKALGGGDTLFVSVAAGSTLAVLEAILGAGTPVVRSMPNTPAAIGQGITALVGNAHCEASDLDLADQMLRAVGQTVRVESEAQMDAVTGVSGSGPAYVFHLIESLAAAGEVQGLKPDVAMKLAMATVAGAGALAQSSTESAAELRRNVTSPNGTTEAGLQVLMDDENGLPVLMRQTVRAATERSKEFAKS